ncbi:MAG: terpene cyclase/mutase family protein [Verrucomicrobia bacterium]|nr:terpene cyclase/mutase family protein [Verrucomicrobiota bacterium]
MSQRIATAQNFLLGARDPRGGWPYRAGQQPSPEPTCYSLCALASPEFEAVRDPGLRWLASRLNAEGALMLEGDDEPHWTTSLLVITLWRLGCQPALRSKAVEFLLRWSGQATRPCADIVVVDGTLHGWPWVSGTFSWVEPTCYALLALKLAGHSQHPRVAEAQRMLLDRVCQDGGWNYGSRMIYGAALQGYISSTTLAALALQDVVAAREPIQRGLAFLEREIGNHRSTLTLALTLLCFRAFGKPVGHLVGALESRQEPDGSWRQQVHLTALAALALQAASGGPNIFLLPPAGTKGAS